MTPSANTRAAPQPSALQAAIALFREPTRVRNTRNLAIPEDVSFLLRVVSRDEQAISEAVRVSQRSVDFVIAAAEFYIEQILFAPQADSYRTLGAHSDMPREKLRLHMVMLLKWLHPDAGSDEARAALAVRVTKAWNDLKTQEKRAVYDADRPDVAARALLRQAASKRKARHGAPRRPPMVPRPYFVSRPHPTPPRPAVEENAPPRASPAKSGSSGLLAFLLGFFHIKLRRV